MLQIPRLVVLRVHVFGQRKPVMHTGKWSNVIQKEVFRW